MDKLEKLVFLEITNKQFAKFPSKEYMDTFHLLDENEREMFYQLSNEIHNIWNQINSPDFLRLKTKYSSVDHFISENKVSPIIIKVINDFELDLKNQISPDFKNLVIKLLGGNFYKTNFEN